MDIEYARNLHRKEVISFLKKNVLNQRWEIFLPPHGTGHETYFARSHGQSYFIKLGTDTNRHQVMSNLGLAPQIIALGYLDDGTSILVQQRVKGKYPSRRDFHLHLKSLQRVLKKLITVRT